MVSIYILHHDDISYLFDHSALNGASWEACYDIRADLQDKAKPISLVYKALITQRTGEVSVSILNVYCNFISPSSLGQMSLLR